MTQHTLEIHYCPKCNWLARASWYAQESLQTFSAELRGVTLCPSEVPGAFQILLNTHVIMDRKTDGFMTAKLLKQKIRDEIAPNRVLGHTDTPR